jgi:hypothetical protein
MMKRIVASTFLLGLLVFCSPSFSQKEQSTSSKQKLRRIVLDAGMVAAILELLESILKKKM